MTNTLALFALAMKLAPFFLKQPEQENEPQTEELVLSDKDVALLELKKKAGAVVVNLGTRDTGKTELSYRLAEFIGKPTYAVSPEQKPHPTFIQRVPLEQIQELPSGITLIMDDLPVYMSNRDYFDEFVVALERIVPMVRHERKWHLIFASQSAAQADKYILDCDMAFFKPLGLLHADLERPHIKKIYQECVNPVFDGKSLDWIHRHAFMYSRTFKGLIEFKRVVSTTVTIDND